MKKKTEISLNGFIFISDVYVLLINDIYFNIKECEYKHQGLEF